MIFPVRPRNIRITPESALDETAIPGSTGSSMRTATSRFVGNYLPSSGLGGYVTNKLKTPSKTYSLFGAQSWGQNWSGKVAEEDGPFVSHLEPWYITPTKINVKGDSNIGAHYALSGPDKDIQSILKMYRDSLKEFSSRYGTPGNRERILLEFEGAPQGTDKFLGWIYDLDLSEEIKSVYLLKYSFSFIGRPYMDIKIQSGKSNGQKDTKLFENR